MPSNKQKLAVIERPCGYCGRLAFLYNLPEHVIDGHHPIQACKDCLAEML